VLKEWLRLVSGDKRRKSDAEWKLKPYLCDDNACIILRLVLENPGIAPDDLAKRSGVHKTAAENYLNGMILNGLVVVEKGAAGEGCHITEAAKAAVAEHLPLNYQCPGMMRE
jgi:hypothetical protein